MVHVVEGSHADLEFKADLETSLKFKTFKKSLSGFGK